MLIGLCLLRLLIATTEGMRTPDQMLREHMCACVLLSCTSNTWQLFGTIRLSLPHHFGCAGSELASASSRGYLLKKQTSKQKKTNHELIQCCCNYSGGEFDLFSDRKFRVFVPLATFSRFARNDCFISEDSRIGRWRICISSV